MLGNNYIGNEVARLSGKPVRKASLELFDFGAQLGVCVEWEDGVRHAVRAMIDKGLSIDEFVNAQVEWRKDRDATSG
jgi:hypothetical protein